MNDLVVLEKIAQWEKLKALVLDSVSSPITKRVYNMALNEFMKWLQQMPRPGFTKATVSAWRVSLEERRLGSSSIIIRMSAIRKLAAEAADNGLLAPELAQGISRVKSVKSTGIRVGNWLSQKQAQALLSAPVVGLRDRASGVNRLEIGEPDLATRFEELAVSSEALESRYFGKQHTALALDEQFAPSDPADQHDDSKTSRIEAHESRLGEREQAPSDARDAAAIERAGRRQGIVNPILAQRAWTRGRLVTESGVGKGTVYEYLDGTREWILFENGRAIADALGLKVEDLPDIRPAH